MPSDILSVSYDTEDIENQKRNNQETASPNNNNNIPTTVMETDLYRNFPGFCKTMKRTERIEREDSGERQFSFNIQSSDMDFHHSRKCSKQQRDPMSHRIIEKRRRDRMNNCLSDLSKLIPHGFLKQGQGRIEKTEIVEMAIKHISLLQQKVEQASEKKTGIPVQAADSKQAYYHGFQTCKNEIVKFLSEVEGVSQENPFCVRLIEHLNKENSKIFKEDSMLCKSEPSNVCQMVNSPSSDISSSNSISDGNRDTTNSSSPTPSSSSENRLKNMVENTRVIVMKEMMSGLKQYADSGISSNMENSGSYEGTRSSSNDTTDEQSKSRGKSFYKFKHTIRRRYCRDKESDSSSGSSNNSESSGRHSPCRSHKSNSNQFGNTSSNARIEEADCKALPGFIIHPCKSHYVPISIHQSMLSELFNSQSSSNLSDKLYHPISIPVHFATAYELKVTN